MLETALNQYRNDGYVIVRNAFNQSSIEAIKLSVKSSLSALCKAYAIDLPDSSWSAIHKASAMLKEKSTAAYLNAIRISQNDPRILASSNHVNLIHALNQIGLECPVVSLKPFLILLAPDLHVNGGYNLRPFHQEWPVMQGSMDGVVTWTALHDVDDRHNALELIPKSHVKGLRPYSITKCGTSVNEDELPPDMAPKRIHLNAGDTVIFSAFMVHRTSPTGHAFRAALTMRYNNVLAQDFINRQFAEPYRLEINRDPENVYNPNLVEGLKALD